MRARIFALLFVCVRTTAAQSTGREIQTELRNAKGVIRTISTVIRNAVGIKDFSSNYKSNIDKLNKELDTWSREFRALDSYGDATLSALVADLATDHSGLRTLNNNRGAGLSSVHFTNWQDNITSFLDYNANNSHVQTIQAGLDALLTNTTLLMLTESDCYRATNVLSDIGRTLDAALRGSDVRAAKASFTSVRNVANQLATLKKDICYNSTADEATGTVFVNARNALKKSVGDAAAINKDAALKVELADSYNQHMDAIGDALHSELAAVIGAAMEDYDALLRA